MKKIFFVLMILNSISAFAENISCETQKYLAAQSDIILTNGNTIESLYRDTSEVTIGACKLVFKNYGGLMNFGSYTMSLLWVYTLTNNMPLYKTRLIHVSGEGSDLDISRQTLKVQKAVDSLRTALQNCACSKI